MLTLFCRHSSHLMHLEAEIEWLKMQMTHERQRAEIAIDHLLALKQGVTPVTRPTREEQMEVEAVMGKIRDDPEFTQAGEVS